MKRYSTFAVNATAITLQPRTESISMGGEHSRSCPTISINTAPTRQYAPVILVVIVHTMSQSNVESQQRAVVRTGYDITLHFIISRSPTREALSLFTRADAFLTISFCSTSESCIIPNSHIRDLRSQRTRHYRVPNRLHLNHWQSSQHTTGTFVGAHA